MCGLSGSKECAENRRAHLKVTFGHLEEPRSGGVHGKLLSHIHLLSFGHTSLLLSRILRFSILLSERLV